MKSILSSSVIMATFASLPGNVHGHGFMDQPMARNVYAHRKGLSGNPANAPGIPLYQTTPQGLNRNNNVCGMDQGYPNNDYDVWIDTQGNPMLWISQAVYNPGDTIRVDTFLTAHHKGYLEVKGCPLGRESSQECFDAYPLEFVKDLLYGMPKDDAYPGRGYLFGTEARLSMQFKLPEDLVGEQVLMQWVYWTANSCNPVGLAEYYSTPKPEGSTGPNWQSLLDTCPPESDTPLAPLPNPDFNVLTPERFINCAEVTVAGDQVPPPPFPAPTLQPPSPPVVSPVPPPVVSPPVVDPDVIGTCGQGNTGNGVCPNNSMCCSKWGHCGYADTGHCTEVAPIFDDGPTGGPVPSPPVSTPVSPPIDGGGARMIAYLGNWQSCPTDEQIAQYSHVVVAFAVSYTWSPNKNICSETCEIMDPVVCENSARLDLIQKWKSMGKKVILSFGGAGMGGSWAGDSNNCWDYCFGRENQVVDRLTSIVNTMGFDGIDVDYEYFYEDNQNGSGFKKGVEAQKFLREVTLGLRSSMPTGTELTHAPMETDMVPGKAYFDLLKEIAAISLDFLMPQYYNGYVRSYTNFPDALGHFSILVNQLFYGDASKVVYGFCVKDCGSFNLDGYQAAEVMKWLSGEYSCNGGAFFWVVNDDVDGSWSTTVKQELAVDDINLCTGFKETPTASPVITSPTDSPTDSPVNAPVVVSPTDSPIATPVNAPVVVSPSEFPFVSSPTESPVLDEVACLDDPEFLFKGKKGKNCKWVKKQAGKFCSKKSSGKKVYESCPQACETCSSNDPEDDNNDDDCKDDSSFRFKGKPGKNCNWIKKKALKNKAVCNRKSNGTKVNASCPVACGVCEVLIRS